MHLLKIKNQHNSKKNIVLFLAKNLEILTDELNLSCQNIYFQLEPRSVFPLTCSISITQAIVVNPKEIAKQVQPTS